MMAGSDETKGISLKKDFAVAAVGMAAVAVFLLGMLTTAFVTFELPEQYSSSARVRVARRDSQHFAVDQQLVQAELGFLTSDEVLNRVIEKLSLRHKWAKQAAGAGPLGLQETLSRLRRRLHARQVRRTAVLEVRAFSQGREEAAAIANALVVAYHDALAAAAKPVSISLLDSAEPALRPSFPNIPLCLTLGAMLSGLLSVGVWAGLRALAARSRKPQ
jgi:uncharacterized protein involved in exopolysaccharide biosynthesis